MVVRVGIRAAHEYCLLPLKSHYLAEIHIIIQVFLCLFLFFTSVPSLKVFLAHFLTEEGCLQRVPGKRFLSNRLIVNPS